jgi:hypothetical protein
MPVQQVVKDENYYQNLLVAGDLRYWTDDAWVPDWMRLKSCLVLEHRPGGDCEVLTDGKVLNFAWNYILDKTRTAGGDDVQG